MRKFYLFSGVFLILLFVTGCSFNINEMGIPFIPTITNTPLPPKPPTPTPTYPPKPENRSGALQTELLDNDATLFTDTELGYQAVFAPEWLVVVMDSPIESQLQAAYGEQIPGEVRDQLTSASELAGIRIFALDYTFKYSFMPALSIHLTFTTNPATLETDMQDLLEQNIEAVPTRMPGANVAYQNVQTNANGLEYGKIIVNQPDETTRETVKMLVAYFKISDGLLVLTGSVPEDEYTVLEPVFQQVIDSFQPIQ